MPREHSPLPWRAWNTDSISDANGRFVADSGLSQWGDSNAEFIVHRVNTYDQLVEALRTIEAHLCDRQLCGHFTAEEIRAEVRAALQLADPPVPRSE